MPPGQRLESELIAESDEAFQELAVGQTFRVLPFEQTTDLLDERTDGHRTCTLTGVSSSPTIAGNEAGKFPEFSIFFLTPQFL